MQSFLKTSFSVLTSAFFATSLMAQTPHVLYQNKAFSVQSNAVYEQSHAARVLSATQLQSSYTTTTTPTLVSREWKLSQDLRALPQFESDIPLANALYNLSLEEMLLNIRPDSAFMAGAKWEGVWTRDISYSIHLALAAIKPETAKISLLKKVQNGVIIQDTGTGGSYPISTDRMTWALAAWEIYAVTGDQNWLRQAYGIIQKSAAQDLSLALDKSTSLFFGESSFLDWREQSYPDWMQPKDIFESKCLGTNAVHYQTYRILEKMAGLLGEKADEYRLVANKLQTAINQRLWLEDKKYYSQFLYGSPFPQPSPRSEALGEALTVLFGVAPQDRQQLVMSNTPVLAYGVPCFYPQIPTIQPYHNNAIWAFVQAYFMWAGAKAQNEAVVSHGIGSIYRQAALFLTNKENMVAQTGSFEGTAINSDRQLWSVAGNLAVVYRIFLGMDFQTNQLVFQPFIPKNFGGIKTLKNFRYRQADLTITVKGFGAKIKQMTIDGNPTTHFAIAAQLTGKHEVVIEMDNQALPESQVNLVENDFSVATPELTLVNYNELYTILKDEQANDGKTIRIYKNGTLVTTSNTSIYTLPKTTKGLAVYQVKVVDPKGRESFLSTPIITAATEVPVIPVTTSSIEDALPELENTLGSKMEFEAIVPYKGKYLIDFYYTNPHGPINTENKCAIRTLFLQDVKKGHIVFPQRGEREQATYGYTNQLLVEFPMAGTYKLSLVFTEQDHNMNRQRNTAIIQKGRLLKID